MTTAVGTCSGANAIPVDDGGRTYHLAAKEGEVANQILLVSDYHIAKTLAERHLTKIDYTIISCRGYHTYTGTYKTGQISIIAFGIGFCMIDFLLREARRITTGPLTIIHLGTGATASSAPLGTAIIAEDAIAYGLDFDYFPPENPLPYQIFVKPAPATPAVKVAIEAGLRFLQYPYVIGRFASTESFVAGIAAPTPASGGLGVFNFKADGLLAALTEKAGEIASLEMDTFPLLWLSTKAVAGDVWAGSVSVAGSNLKGEYLKDEDVLERILKIGPVLLSQLEALRAAR
jgi:uridine phosphorylase